jgi:hypothetical protein
MACLRRGGLYQPDRNRNMAEDLFVFSSLQQEINDAALINIEVAFISIFPVCGSADWIWKSEDMLGKV